MITGFAFGRFTPGKSVLHRMDPGVKIIGVALLISIGFFSRGLLDLLTVAAVVGLALLASNPDLRKIWSDFRALYLLYLVTIVLHAILNPGTSLVDLPFGLVITIEGLQRGLYFAIKIAMIAVLVGAVLRTTHPAAWGEIMEFGSSRGNPLGRFIQPLTLTFGIAVRFLPLILEEADRIRMAQVSRGFRPGGGLIKRIKSLQTLLIPMVASSLDKVDTITAAMQVRGFRLGAERSKYLIRTLAWFDYTTLMLCAGVIAVFVLK